MKDIHLLLVGAAVLSAVVGCSKTSDNKNTPIPSDDRKGGDAAPVDLAGKSADDILQIKYDKVLLKCGLWIQQTLRLDISVPPTDSVSVDLLAKPALPLTLKLKGQIENHRIAMDLTVRSLAVFGSLRHTDVSGNVYVATNSPYVKVDETYASQTVFGPHQWSHGSGFDHRELLEKIVDIGLNDSLSSVPTNEGGVTIDRGAFRDYVQCLLETAIKPEYQDQFQTHPQPN